MAADKNITIKFIADGDKELIGAFKNLATAQGKFNKTSKTTTTSTSKVNASFQKLALEVKNTVGSFKKLNRYVFVCCHLSYPFLSLQEHF